MKRKSLVRGGCGPLVFAATHAALGASVAQNSLEYSDNWSGYAAIAASEEAFTDISSTWVIPTVEAPSSGTTYSADWIGFDGDTDGTVEQCGTSSQITSRGATTYYAWYEFYPADEVEVGLTVHPGDTIAAQIIYESSQSSSGNYAYYFDLTDETTGGSFTDTIFTANNDARSSVEWIDEAPTVGNKQSTLADFGSATFTGDVAGLDGGSAETLSSLSDSGIGMIQKGDVVALPSSINSSGEAFTINYGSAAPSITWDNASAPSPNDGATWDVSNNYNWREGNFNTVYTDGSNVTFNDANNGHYAVTLNSMVSPGSVIVNNSSGNYTISGSGGIEGTGSLTKSGSGMLTLNTVNGYSGGTMVDAGELIVGVNGALPNGAVSISGGTVQLASNTGVAQITSLSVSGGGVLDVTNNTVILNTATTNPSLSAYQTLVTNGYNSGTWTGTTSITSSWVATEDGLGGPKYGVAVVESNGGQVSGLTSSQIEIAPALLGDADLAGSVGFADYLTVLGDYGKTGQDWQEGNFDYTGTVDFADYLDVLGNYGDDSSLTAVQLAGMESFASENGYELIANSDNVGFQVIAVPEPASVGLLLLGGTALLGKRRRRMTPAQQRSNWQSGLYGRSFPFLKGTGDFQINQINQINQTNPVFFSLF